MVALAPTPELEQGGVTGQVALGDVRLPAGGELGGHPRPGPLVDLDATQPAPGGREIRRRSQGLPIPFRRSCKSLILVLETNLFPGVKSSSTEPPPPPLLLLEGLESTSLARCSTRSTFRLRASGNVRERLAKSSKGVVDPGSRSHPVKSHSPASTRSESDNVTSDASRLRLLSTSNKSSMESTKAVDQVAVLAARS